jgi:hypothetical protein
MNDLSDTFPLTNDLLKPWSMPALLLTAVLLMAAAAWSYLRASGGKRYRVGVVLGIRLVALVLVFLALSGTSCVNRDELKVPSILIVAVDASESMSAIKDEVGRASRWEYLLATLRDCKPILDKLRDDHNIKVVYYKFGDEVGEFDPDDPGKADGKRTDTASLLRFLHDKYRGERYLRGLVILSDGADNVASDPPARSLAARFRNLPCPVYTIAFGSKSTAAKENDIVLTSAVAEPSLVPAKGKVTVRALIDSLGRINDTVRVSISLNDKEVAAETTMLQLRKNNEVRVSFDAPAERGEYKLTVKVQDKEGRRDSLPGELSAENNKLESFLTVTREGVSVLLVERQERFPEPQILLDAIATDRRIRVDVAWLRGPEQLDPNQKGLFQFDQQPYDVILLGDVTAARLREADPRALEKIKERVFDKGAGLMMLGGPRAFGNGDWIGTPIEDILPVRLRNKEGPPVTGESKNEVTLKPTAEGLRYLLRIADTPQASEDAWLNKVQGNTDGAGLLGVTKLGDPVPGAQVFALSGDQPLLVGRKVNKGRALAFGGSTSFRWIRPKTGGKDAHARFWRQAILWLAQQEDSDDNLRIRPETRRLRVGDNLGFGVQLYGKQGEEVKDAKFEVTIIDEKGGKTIVPVLPGPQNPLEHRGTYKPRRPGIYRIKASGKGHHPSGKAQKEVTGETEVRFIAYQDDAETTEKAANPDFLGELAVAGGTQSYRRPGELKRLLESLPSKPLPNPPPRPSKFPDWRTTKGRSPFLVAFLLLFVQVLTLEWFLRRRWGMV